VATPDYSTTELLAAARRGVFAPDASDQSDTDLLAFADDVLAGFIAADVRAGREEFWLTSSDITIVPGTYVYDLPRRALAQSTRGIMAVTPQGQTYELDRMDPLAMRGMFIGSGLTQTWPSKFAFVSSNTFRIGSTVPEAGWVLRVFYLLTPPKLIATSEACLIEDVASASELTVTGTPPTDTFATGALFDVVSGSEPYPTTFTDLVVAAPSAGAIETTTLPFTFGDPSVPPAQQVGRQPDYAVPAQTTVYPPVPRTLWPALVEGVGARMLAATRDPQAGAKMQSAMAALRDAQAVMQPRDNSRSMSIVGSTALRSAGSYRRGWGWR
jgi:hypothetical protein